MHLKRQKVPKTWPIPRKGTTYLVKPSHNLNSGVPVLVALRDILKLTQNRKETKKALNDSLILLNNKKIRNEKNSMSLFDVLTIVPSKKNYKLILNEKGKFDFEETKNSDGKIAKVTNKKILKKKKVQLNLNDGRNYLSEIKCNVNDSVLIDFKTNKIEKCLPLNEKSKVFVFGGKHAGQLGIIGKIDSKNKLAKLKTSEGEINVLIKQLVVVE